MDWCLYGDDKRKEMDRDLKPEWQLNQLDLIPREWDNVHTYIALYALVIVNLF